ncbi:PQQ-binding-like beta-propeller repeat protein [Halorussus salilacus]|uniref:outer membrane protein assembly factor BamB family protein n=1 Tax=Halorussus salilacus TaxID=2953750 RepID=UPI0020A0EFFD|nr:PQQ-binding-like beta-propeller repeat protein [Halorussus salilacus]USZ69325.1 PQQ-binding-like beta-propeller repeat protein [Halorussus salilacus]
MPSSRVSTRRELLRVAGATLSVSLAGCVGGDLDLLETDGDLSCSDTDRPFPDDWPLIGYDRRNTSANPNATGPREGVEVRWTDGGPRGFRGAPILAGEAVYVQKSPTHLTAFERDDGTERWSIRLGTTDDSTQTTTHSGSHQTPAVVGDTVYVGGGNAEVEKDGPELDRLADHFGLYAVDRHTGDVRWTIRPDDFVDTPPVVVGDLVLFVTRVGTVYAVDTMEESVAWTLSVGTRDAPLPPLAVDGCRLYLGTVGDGLYAIDVERGELSWDLSELASRAAPAVADGIVYVGGADGVLYAVNAESESVEWKRDLGRAISMASPAIASGTVFVGTADGDPGEERTRVRALDAETGDERWTAETEEYVKSSPAVADGVVYVAARERIFGFDAETGDELWTHEVHGGVSAPLSVADGTVYAATTHGQLYALAEPSEYN